MPELKNSATLAWSESGGDLEGTVQGDVSVDSVTVANGGTIGSSTTTDAITIASNGAVTLNRDLILSEATPSLILNDSDTRPHRIRAVNEYLQIEADYGDTGTGSEVRVLTDTNTHTAFEASGNIGLINGNLRLATGGTGVDFSGSGTAAEILDDYEEGTWTPEFVPGSGSFTTMTYNTQVGEYTKIGNVVQFRCILSTDNVDLTGASGSLQIDGLPFTPLQSAFSVAEMLLWANAYNTIQADRSGGNIRLLRTAYGSTFSILQTTDLTTGASTDQNRITIAGTFFTA